MISAHAEKGNQGEHQKGGSPDADETEKCECIDKIWQGISYFRSGEPSFVVAYTGIAGFA